MKRDSGERSRHKLRSGSMRPQGAELEPGWFHEDISSKVDFFFESS